MLRIQNTFSVWDRHVLRSSKPLRGFIFFFKQKTAYEVLLCDWSSDVCSSDLAVFAPATDETGAEGLVQRITDAVARTAAVKLRAGTSTAPAGTRPSGGRSSTNLHLPAPPSPTELLDRARLALN